MDIDDAYIQKVSAFFDLPVSYVVRFRCGFWERQRIQKNSTTEKWIQAFYYSISKYHFFKKITLDIKKKTDILNPALGLIKKIRNLL